MEEFGGELIIGLLVVTLCIFIFIGGMLIALIHILVKKTNFFNEEFEEYVITSANKKAIRKLRKEQRKAKNE